MSRKLIEIKNPHQMTPTYQTSQAMHLSQFALRKLDPPIPDTAFLVYRHTNFPSNLSIDALIARFQRDEQ